MKKHEVCDRMKKIEREAGLVDWAVPCADAHISVVSGSDDPEAELEWYAHFCRALKAIDSLTLSEDEAARLEDQIGDWDIWLSVAKRIIAAHR